MNLKRLFDFSPQARLWCRIAVFMFLFGLLASVGNGFGMGKPVEGFLFALGFFVLPFIALLLGVAALSEPYHLPRATLWAAATGVLAGASLVASITLAVGSEAGTANASAFWFACCLPPLIVALGLGLYFIVRGWAEAQQEMAKGREARALELIQNRGVITLADLAVELRLPVDESEALVQRLVENRTLFEGLLDLPRATVYSRAALQAKLERLADLTKGEPEIRVDDLALGVQAPRELIPDWLRYLAREHHIAGYLHGGDGAFHRLAREQWEGTSVCPNCGAAWSSPGPGGAGLPQCPQCRSEIFL